MKIEEFLYFLPRIYLCQFGLNLAIGSEDRVETKLYITDKTWKLGQGH